MRILEYMLRETDRAFYSLHRTGELKLHHQIQETCDQCKPSWQDSIDRWNMDCGIQKEMQRSLWKCETHATRNLCPRSESRLTYFEIMPWMCCNWAPVHGQIAVIGDGSDPCGQLLFQGNSSCWRRSVSGHNGQLGANLVTPVWLLYAELSALHKKSKKRRQEWGLSLTDSKCSFLMRLTRCTYIPSLYSCYYDRGRASCGCVLQAFVRSDKCSSWYCT
jgi:hypothetical protein